jgi:hypothetical protein
MSTLRGSNFSISFFAIAEARQERRRRRVKGAAFQRVSMGVQNPWREGGICSQTAILGQFFASHPGLDALAVFQASNAQNPQGQQGLIIFVNPASICTNPISPGSRCQIGNESTLFHESLHEFYDYTDPTIEGDFGISVNVNPPCTANITDYIAYVVFNQTQNSGCPY